MVALTNIFTGNPLLLAAISAIFLIAYFLTRNNPNLRAKALLAPAIGWLAWALWNGGSRPSRPRRTFGSTCCSSYRSYSF